MLSPNTLIIAILIGLACGCALLAYALCECGRRSEAEYEAEMFRRWRIERDRIAIPADQDRERDVC